MLIWQKTTSFETQMTKKETLTNICLKTFNVCSKPFKSKESFETPSPDFHLKLQFFFRKRCLLVSEDVQEKSFIFFYFFYIWWSTYTNLFSVPRDKLPKQFSLEKSANEKQIKTVRQFFRNNQRNWLTMILDKLYQISICWIKYFDRTVLVNKSEHVRQVSFILQSIC